MLIAKVEKWGNDLAIQLPQEVVDILNIVEGSNVSIEVNQKTQEINLRNNKPRVLTLEEIVEQITPENLHPVIDWGKPVGNEVW